MERYKERDKESTSLEQIHPIAGHEVPEREQSYSFSLSLTPGLNGGEWIPLSPMKDDLYPFLYI